MKQKFITYILFGILGGLIIFLIDLFDVYFRITGWIYFFTAVSIIFVPMFLHRLKKNASRSFSAMFRIGIIVTIMSAVSYSIISQVYPRIFFSEAEKTRLVDEKVNRLIMEFDGPKIDIFEMEESALSFFEPDISRLLMILALLAPFLFFLTVLFALVLKKEKV